MMTKMMKIIIIIIIVLAWMVDLVMWECAGPLRAALDPRVISGMAPLGDILS